LLDFKNPYVTFTTPLVLVVSSAITFLYNPLLHHHDVYLVEITFHEPWPNLVVSGPAPSTSALLFATHAVSTLSTGLEAAKLAEVTSGISYYAATATPK
jgi:hydroxyacyl-ACP dehydratase HTD2-like protein with hotdog domain